LKFGRAENKHRNLLLVLPLAFLMVGPFALLSSIAYKSPPQKSSTSAGYQVLGYNGLSAVYGDFSVPAVKSCVRGQLVGYEIGLQEEPGGFDGAGVDISCTGAVYTAYLVQQNKDQYPSHLPVFTGDVMSVQVSYDFSTQIYTVDLQDHTQNWGHFETFHSATSPTTANFALERACGTPSCPIPNFGKILTRLDKITIGGKQGTLSYWESTTYPKDTPYAVVLVVNMVDSNGNTLATTSSAGNIMFVHSS